jgi:hypothetical protein
VYGYFCRYLHIRKQLVIEDAKFSACQQVNHMNGSLGSFAAEAMPTRKLPSKRDTASSCRERASADLLRSLTMFTVNERLILERSAASWTERAQLLDRVEGNAPKSEPSSEEPRT